MRIMFSAVPVKISTSLAKRRKWPSQAKVRSTTQRLGCTTNPSPKTWHDMEHQVELLVHKRDGRPPISLVPTKGRHGRILRRRALQHRTPRNGIGLIGRVHLDVEQISQGIYDDMAFAPLDSLVSVDTPLLTPVLRLDALRVDEPVTGCGRFGRFFRCRAVISLKACSHTPRKFQVRK